MRFREIGSHLREEKRVLHCGMLLLGFAALLYFANIVANLSENAEWLRFVTPFAYTDAADIITDVAFDPLLVGLGMAYAVVGLAVAFVVYARKDVRA